MCARLNIAVIGGGIAGLGAALACQKKGFEVTLYERNEFMNNIGGGISLFAHGYPALDILGVQPQFDKITDPIQNYAAYDGNTLLMQDSFDAFSKEVGGPLQSCLRGELQSAMATVLGTEHIHLNTTVTSITQDEDQAFLKLSTGEIADADVVIAADGIRSRALGGSASRHYTGYGFWGGVLESKQCVEMPPHTLYVLFGLGKMSWILTLPDDRQWWYVAHRMPEKGFIQSADKISQIKELCQGWSTMVDHVLSADQTSENFALPIYDHRPMPQWSLGRIVGIGDAIHAMGPTSGVGANTALIDALCLAQNLSENQSVFSAIETYEISRKPLMGELQQVEQESAAIKLSSDLEVIQKRNQKIQQASVSQLLDKIKPTILGSRESIKRFHNTIQKGGV